MDSVNISCSNNEHFVGIYTSTFVAAMIAAYPNASWRMQARSSSTFPAVSYQWTSIELSNSFAGRIAISGNNLIMTAPLAEVQSLLGEYVYDVRLEDPSNAVIDVLGGALTIEQGVSRISGATIVPVPSAIGTVTFTNPAITAAISAETGFHLGSMTVEDLPTVDVAEGMDAWAINGRKPTEGAGSGTGVPVFYSAGSWYTTALIVVTS